MADKLSEAESILAGFARIHQRRYIGQGTAAAFSPSEYIENIPREEMLQRVGSEMRRSVYIVEDHPIFFDGLKGLLDRHGDFEVVGHATDVSQAKDEIPQRRPDLILLDLALPDGTGFDLIQYLKAVRPEQRMLVISGLDQSLYACRAVRMGAQGFLSKRMAASKAVEAMRVVAEGDLYLDSDLKQMLLEDSVGQRSVSSDPLEALTDRELDVYRMIGTGLSVQEIAGRLHLSPKTIETYRANIKRKLGVPSARDLIRDATIWCLEGRREEAVEKDAA